MKSRLCSRCGKEVKDELTIRNPQADDFLKETRLMYDEGRLSAKGLDFRQGMLRGYLMSRDVTAEQKAEIADFLADIAEKEAKP